ncbi:MAG TPA: Rrf2 family transcriptional regulator [Syntrophomonadaceae bacterium]|nr:Rrf2 family transcriptional regulator [Syntrophomonadaceae bacterium]
MQLSSRFPVAVQMLIILAWCPEDIKITSDAMASSVNTNPALIRRIMGYLKKADLIAVAPGVGGTRLTRNIDEITLLDVYQAVELTDDDRLFGLHDSPNPQCPIGNRINEVLLPYLEQAREALEASLAAVTLEQLLEEFPPFDYRLLPKMS